MWVYGHNRDGELVTDLGMFYSERMGIEAVADAIHYNLEIDNSENLCYHVVNEDGATVYWAGRKAWHVVTNLTIWEKADATTS
jgi:hypothetical protein